jgi:hypothetical protein
MADELPERWSVQRKTELVTRQAAAWKQMGPDRKFPLNVASMSREQIGKL